MTYALFVARRLTPVKVMGAACIREAELLLEPKEGDRVERVECFGKLNPRNAGGGTRKPFPHHEYHGRGTNQQEYQS